ncbi:MAG: MATE family efflux transporter [Christensenellales bacterium]|jgi:putative MATE family efflux protein
MVKEKAFYRTIFAIALPAAFHGLISFLVVLADNMMVSSLGTLAFSGVSITNSMTALFTAAVSGIVSGSGVLISQYWGKKDTARIKQVFSVVTILVMALSACVTILVRCLPAVFLGLLTDKRDVIEAAMPYATFVCFSYIPFALSSALVGMLRAVEVVKVTLYVAIMSLAVNVGLNYVLIYGHLGFPALGVKGAAIATVIARVAELSVVWVYAFKIQRAIDIRPQELLKPGKGMWLDYMKYGLPVGIGDAQWALVGVLKASIIGHLDKVVIGANTIAENMMGLGMIFTSSLAAGAVVVIGKTVGQKDYARTRQYSNTIQLMFFAFGLIISVLLFLLRKPFVSLYDAEAQVALLAADMIGIGAVTMIGTTYHASCFVGINRGAGDSRFVMIVDLICGWLVVLPISYVAAFIWKVDAKWMFLFLRIDQCFKWIIAFIRLRGNKWIKNVTRD